MSFPKTTRYGADPLVDPELATKKYVDDNAGGGGSSILTGFSSTPSSTFNGAAFYPIGADRRVTGQTTESVTQQETHFAFQLNRIIVNCSVNNKDEIGTQALRDDGVSIGAVTIAAGTTGQFDSGALTDDVAILSDINLLEDNSASSSGGTQFGIHLEILAS